MSDKIVGFSIEIKGKNQIVDSTKLLGLLNTQLILINNSLIEIKKNSANSLGDVSKEMKIVGSSAQKMGAVVKEGFRSFSEGNKTIENLGNGFFEVTREVEKTAKAIKGLSKEELIQLEIDKDILRENKAIAKQQAIIQREGKDNIASLRAQLSLATIEWKKFTVAELNNTAAGKSVAAEKKRLTELLVKEEKATGDARRQVGFYENATKTLGKTLLKLSVGRDIIRGLFTAFTDIVKNGASTNNVFAGIIKSFDRLKTFATGLATSFLNLFGGAIIKTIENFTFVFSKVADGVKFLVGGFNDLAASGGVLGTVFSFVGNIFKGLFSIILEFPAVLGGVASVFGNFKDQIVKSATEISLQFERVFVSIKRIGTAITGGDTTEIDKRLAGINAKLAENVVFAKSIGEAFKEGYDNTIKAQEEFKKNTDNETEALAKRDAAAKRQEEARDAAKEAEKKRTEELKADRAEALKDIQANSQARLQIIKDLSKELISTEISTIQDQTEQALAAERQRFEIERQQRNDNFNAVVDDLVNQQAKITALFGDNSEELKQFTQDSAADLLQIQQTTNAISEIAAIQHQDNLTKIKVDGEQARKDAAQKAFDDEVAATEIEYAKFLELDDQQNEQLLVKQMEADSKAKEAKKESIQQFVTDAQTIVSTVFDAISSISQIASEAENARFDEAIARREETINNLNEQLQNATGLQKKFLERQVSNEEAALAEQTKAKEKALREQAETAKAIAIVQAIIGAALAITNAFTLPPPASFIAAAATAVATAVQIGVIASQKFAKGGILRGKSHAEGGIPASVGGTSIELEGGEAVMNKVSTSKHRALLSAINVDGGGRSFAAGGVLSAPLSAPSLSSTQNDVTTQFTKFVDVSLAMAQATNNRIDRLQVVQDLNNLQDIQKNDARLQVLTTLK